MVNNQYGYKILAMRLLKKKNGKISAHQQYSLFGILTFSLNKVQVETRHYLINLEYVR